MNHKIFKNFAIYSAGALTLKSIGAVISFISISYLNPDQYGNLALLNTFIAILPIFLNLGLRQVFSLDFFHSTSIGRKKIIVDIIAIYLCFAVPILFFLICNIHFLNQYIFLNQINNNLIFIGLIISFIYFFVELFFQLLRYQSKAFQLSIIQICMGIINAFFAIILIYFFNLKITGILLSNLISMIIIFLYAFYLYTKKIGYLNFESIKNKERLLYYLKYGLPFIPSILFNWLMSFGDRWILAQYKNMHEVGIYSFADSFGQIYQALILLPLTGSYLPYIFEQFAKNKDQILEIDKWNYKNMWRFLTTMLFVSIIGFFSFKKILYLVLPIKYHASIKFILLILIEQIIFSASYFATCYLTFFKMTHLTISLTIFAAILNLILNVILIPKYAIYGCIFSTIIAYSIYLFLIIFVTKISKEKTLLTHALKF